MLRRGIPPEARNPELLKARTAGTRRRVTRGQTIADGWIVGDLRYLAKKLWRLLGRGRD
jgi:hypothetical protein